MADSFFSTKNQFDDQLEGMPRWVSDAMIDAAARRIIVLDGHLGAYRRLQRLADLCAGANVLPIEHWQALEQAIPPATAEDADTPRWWRFSWFSAPSFWLGFAMTHVVGWLL